jgi:hypothetical protein
VGEIRVVVAAQARGSLFHEQTNPFHVPVQQIDARPADSEGNRD